MNEYYKTQKENYGNYNLNVTEPWDHPGEYDLARYCKTS
jgi:hypothetical protein